MSVDLQQRWSAGVASFPGSATTKTAAFAEIISFYSKAHRHYHGVAHLEALFDLLDRHAPPLAAPAPLHFAVWWHDVIYDSRAADNEAKSAVLACVRLGEMGAASALIDEVEALILATKDHWAAPPMGDGDYFLDADIAILGARAPVYDQYAADVRAEFVWAPDDLYRAGRGRFLSAALARERLFRTEEFNGAYGRAAHENMERELMLLS